ncbi:MAG: S8 family serine peptidase [Candidatus Thiodiazotropha taylori]
MRDPIQFDPNLKELLLRRTGDHLGSEIKEEIVEQQVPVVIRLHDINELVSGIQIIAQLGHIITARIPLGKIIELRQHPNVASLKSSLPYEAELSISVEDINAQANQLQSAGIEGIDGRGVTLGVIDWGVDFAHRDLRNADGSTRLVAIWDQRGGQRASSPTPYGYGREFTRDQINTALATTDPYTALGIDPAQGDPSAKGSHGTHVTAIAAGSGLAPNSVAGVAPGTDLIFVHLKGDDTQPEDSLGDSVRLLEAVHYVLTKSEDQPVVINMSLGRTGDSKDGTSPVEQALDAVLAQQPGRAVCLSTGNYFDARLHASGVIDNGAQKRLRWELPGRDDDIAEMEIWYPGRDRLGVRLLDPFGKVLAEVGLGESKIIRRNNTILASIYHRKQDPNNGDNQINVFLWPEAVKGTWQIELTGVAIEDGHFDAYIERERARIQSRFHPQDADPYSTVGTLTCGHLTIPVGAYDARLPSRPMLSFSSAGPSRDGRQVPLVSAPGARICAARSTGFDVLGRRFKDGLIHKSGTSMAAPHVSGVVALMMQASGDEPLDATEIREILQQTARPNDMPIERSGAGMVDAAAAVGEVLRRRQSAINSERVITMEQPEEQIVQVQETDQIETTYTDTYEVDLETDPVLFSGQAIELRFPRAVDADSAQDAIRISPFVAGDVILSEDQRELRWHPRTSLKPGAYHLHIGDIEEQNGPGKFAGRVINFSAEAGSMHRPSLSGGHDIIHRSEGRLPVTRKRLQVIKAVQNSNDKVKQYAADQRGRRVNYRNLISNERKAYIRKYKKLHPYLYDRVKRLGRSETISIAVWAYVEERFVDKYQYYAGRREPLLVASREMQQGDVESATPPSALVAYRSQISEVVNHLAATMRERIGAKVNLRMQLAPVIIAHATKSQINGLARLEDVAGIYYYDREAILNLTNALSVSGANTVISSVGYKGTNIRVGVWEGGPDNLSQLTIQEHFDSTRSVKSNHARLVTAVIKNKQSSGPKGFAPEAKIYAANKYTVDALQWAVKDKQCTVINQSFHRRNEARKGEISFDDRLKDYLATHYPYPTIVHAAGNYWAGDSDGVTPPSNEYVNHKGYNTLSIGNHNDSASAMSGSSVFRNPPSTHGDRELPELCANGTGVSAVGLSMSGTSFASPAVAGSVALLQNANNTLIRWPEANRAILMAAARKNVKDSSWWRDVSNKNDAADGAGALNTREAIRIARNQQTRNNTATSRGWAIGTLYNNDFDSDRISKYFFRVNVPISSSRRKVKVTLAWDSKASDTPFTLFGKIHHIYTSMLMVDLDIHVYNGSTRVAHSSSFDNSYEIAEFTGTPGKTYTIKIYRHRGNQPTYFGLAWTVHS